MTHLRDIQTSLVTSYKNIRSEHIIFEIIGEKDIKNTEYFDIDKNILSLVKENLLQKKDSREKTMQFGHGKGNVKKVTFFFSSPDSIMDDRCSLFHNLPTQTLFVPAREAQDAYEALILSTYRYQHYLSKKEQYSYELYVSEREKSKIEQKIPLFEAILEARDLINESPSFKYPEMMVNHIKKCEWKHFDLHIFDAKELKKLGCNLLLAVGAGSDYPPYMAILTPKNPPKGEKYALVGKGVTFDAGGIQIKPDTAMLDMKCDMSGAAGVLGVARYLDALPSLPANIIIAMGFTENMTGGKAYKPLDIYKAYNGTTVEIHHTDAEGRLVLADVMSYVEDVYHVDHIITMATLTGACVYALGHDIAGIMGDDEMVISTLIDNSSPYEPLWRLPQTDKIKKSLKADIADIKNVARSEKAGSSIGGAFLSYFQGKAKLTHLDIAGPAYRETVWGYMPKGGTGWGVRVLSDFFVSLSHGNTGKSSSPKSSK